MTYFVLSDGRFVKQKPDQVIVDVTSKENIFVLQRHFWRGQIIIRFGASTQHWDLRIKKTDGSFIHFVLKDDPSQNDSTSAYLKPMESDSQVTLIDGTRINPMDIRDRVALKPEPDNPDSANPTKNTPAFLETLAYGKAGILLDGADFKKFDFHGSNFSGGWMAVRESPDAPFWEFKQSTGPKVTAQAERVPIFKTDDEQHLLWGVVMEPMEKDTQGHYATAVDIASALHFYAINWRLMDEQHERVVPPAEAIPVEFMQVPVDIEWPVGDSVYLVKAGSWVQVTYVPDPELWRKVKAGEINGYSIRGWGRLQGE